MNKFISLFALLFIALFVNSAAAQDNTLAGAAWQVTKYDITATLPAAATDRNLNAKATLNLRNVGRGAGATVTLRINPKAEVTAAQVNGATANFRKTSDEKIGGFQRFTVSLPGSVQPNGTTVVNIEYKLAVAENSGLNAITPIGSQFLPLSLWYPTPTNPYSPKGADFAPFKLQVTAPNGETVISSGKGNGAAFEQNLNAQPFFVTGSWDAVESTSGTAIYLPKGAAADERKRAEDIAVLVNEAKTFTTGFLGTAPETPALKIIAVRRGAGFADGGTILLDTNVFRRPKLDSATAMLIAEAIAKISLGNTTSIKSEGYGTIQEGLARFIATQFIEKQFGKEAADVERQRQRTSYVVVAKRDAPLSQTSPADITYFASAANKGAMIWRLVAREMGEDKFFGVVRSQLQSAKADGLTLVQLRESLVLSGGDKVKAILAYGLDEITDIDLLVGLPQQRAAETVVVLRNAGSLPVNINVAATSERGERLNAAVNLGARSFGEAVFKTTAKIVRVEADADKFYPQFDYSNDFAPREITENDWSAAIAVSFNRQEFPKAEATARKILAVQPRHDDARTWLGRALIEQNRLDDAEKEFTAALSERLPTAKTLAWANIGLGEIALRRNQNANAAKFFDSAVRADAEYASNLAARQGRLKAETAPTADEAAKTFFAAFDKAVITARKAEVDNYILNGELTKFSGGITGNQPEIWQTKVLRTEQLDSNRVAVDASLDVKVINQDPKSGTALFILARTANGWRLADVDLFEVR
jgi:tetratricopeptide (TPR) repeat protein